MKKKFLKIIILLLLLIISVGIVACEKGDDTEYKPIDDQVLPTTYDCEAYPRAKGNVQQQINWIKIERVAPFTDTMLAVTMQGIVNRENPSFYVVHTGMVQHGLTGDYWLAQLDNTYKNEDGTPYFTKNEFTSLNQAIAMYRDKFNGAVIYDEKIVSNSVVDPNANNYGYMAVGNLLTMMCAQEDLLPLTRAELASVNAYLTSVGKTALLEKHDITSFSSESDNRAMWKKATLYTLEKAEKGEWDVSDKVIGHDGTLNIAWRDYSVMQKAFHYTRIFSTEATDEEKSIEDRIMALTKDNTAVMGVWHLVGDENSLVTYVNEHKKFFEVTHETWNLSWSSGLPRASLEEKTEELTYDDSKVYIAMSLSEGDNSSYTYNRLPNDFQQATNNYGNIVMSWPICAMAYDLCPNIIEWANYNAKSNVGFVAGESGIGYLNPDLTSLSSVWDMKDFYATTNGYLGEMFETSAGKRTYRNDLVPNIYEVIYMNEMDYLLSGYGAISGYSTNEYLSGKGNMYFRETPVFQAIGCNSSPEFLLTSKIENGSFLYIGLSGWGVNLSATSQIIEQCPDNYVFVTSAQLADLYEQKMSKYVKDITYATFNADNGTNEMLYLWSSDNYQNVQETIVAGQESFRYGSKESYVVYKFDLNDSVTSASISATLSGEYVMSVSSDLENWVKIGRYDIKQGDKTYGVKRQVRYDVPSAVVKDNHTVYVMLTDPTTNDGVGYKLYGMSVTTDKVSSDEGVTVDGLFDKAYYYGGGSINSSTGYRTGEVIYKLPIDASKTARAFLTVESQQQVVVSYSIDGKNFYDANIITSYIRTTSASTGNLYTADLDSIVDGMLIKVSTSGDILALRVTPVVAESGFVGTPIDGTFEKNHMLTGWDIKHTTQGTQPFAKLDDTSVLTYAFISEGATNLEVYATGLFKIEISVDGRNWTTLKQVAQGENVNKAINYNIGTLVKKGNLCFIRISKSATSGNAMYYYSQLS